MKPHHKLAIAVAMAVLPTLATTKADAQQRPVNAGLRITLPSHANHFSWDGHHHRFHGGSGGFHGGVFIVEREVPVIIEREVVREVKVAAPPVAVAAPANPRKPYAIGGTYASLPPQGCMKLIEDGASYYFCGGGEWYRPLGDGRAALYRAVAKP